MPTLNKQAPAVQLQRLSEWAPVRVMRQSDLTGMMNRESQTEMIWPAIQAATTPVEGFTFIETPRAPVFADAGSSTTLTDVYATIFTGQQAIAKAFSTAEGLGPTPRIIMSPVIDKLLRFVPISWYHLVGYARFREAALRRVESSSSIGTNA